MRDNEELPEDEEFNQDELGDANDPVNAQPQDFLDKLKLLSDEAEANASGRQNSFEFDEDADEEVEPFKPEFAGDTQNPKESHELFYAIQRLLRKGLPTGDENRFLRNTVHREKKLYLRAGVDEPADGSPIGADSRQAYLQHLRAAYMKTQVWAARAGSAYDAFQLYYDLNKEAGYR